MFETVKSLRTLRWGALASALLLSSCNGIDSLVPKHEKPLPHKIEQRLKAKGMKAQSPIMIRIFKTENVLEIWKPQRTGKYAKLDSFEICKWSGKLGPKFKEGDRQAPEGFYTVGPRQMNPNSQYHLSFNMGFPNTYDRSHDRTGTYLMIHGACSSAGCYSMNDDQVEVIYALAREAFKGGQRKFQIQAFPFRMTAKNMAKHVDSPHFEFWKMLKQGYDHFELTKRPPKVDVCGRKYVFNKQVTNGAPLKSRAECPAMAMPESLALAFSERQIKENEAFQKILKWQNKPLAYSVAAPDVLDGSLLQTAIKPKPKVIAKPEPKPEPVPVASAEADSNKDARAETNPVSENAKVEAPADIASQDASNGAAQTVASAEQPNGDGAVKTDSGPIEGLTTELPQALQPKKQLLPEVAPVPEMATRP